MSDLPERLWANECGDWQDDSDGDNVEYVRADALPAVQVTVKPLEWVELAITKEPKGLSGVWLHAWGINGQYEVHVFDTDPTHVMLNGPDIVPTEIHVSIEAAKAAAQADYETRIRAALIPTAGVTPEVAALLDIIRWVHDTLYEINPDNYDHDEVCKLNVASVEVILGLASILGEKHGKTDDWWQQRSTLAEIKGESHD